MSVAHRPFSHHGRRLMLLTAGLGLVLATVLAGIDTMVASRLQMSDLEYDIDQMLQANLPSLEETLWLGDATLVHSQLKGLINFRGIAYATVHPAGRPPITVGTRPAASTPVFERSLNISRSYRTETVPLGTLTIVTDLTDLHRDWRHSAVRMLLTQLIQVALVAGGLLILYQRLVGRRIARLADRLDSARHGIPAPRSDDEPPARMVPDAKTDELDLLSATLEQLLTEQAQHLRQLSDAHELLEQHVEERTRELSAEVSLHHRTRAELDRSNQDLEQFAYAVSHDLQEPLRMVASYLQLLSRRYAGRLDSNADDYIAFAVDGAKRMHQMVADLLDYSRVHSLGAEHQPIDAAEALGDALHNLEGALRDKQARISVGLLPVIAADRGQLVRLFQNLIGNALKYSEEGRVPEVEISAERTGADWLFRIRDNGIGIEEAHFERIFGVFQRLHPHNRYDGTGIGLALCKRIVERHGGRIWVRSQPGDGSAFFFTLPTTAAAPDVAAEEDRVTV